MLDILTFLCIVVCIIALNVAIRHHAALHLHNCKHCSSIMEYKGKKQEDKTYYLFYCPHCKAWEKISKEELNEYINSNSLIDL